MKFSIIICTKNRSTDLHDTLKSFLNQDHAQAVRHEIIVVDNASTDNTAQVVNGLLPDFQGRLRYVYEAKKGIPFARNRGIRESIGDIVAFVDDDCIAHGDYLISLKNIFEGLNPKIGFVGGKIEALFEPNITVPEWVKLPFFLGPLAVLDHGNQPLTVGKDGIKHQDRLFYSANLAVKKELFTCHGFFNEKKLLTGDTDLCLRFLAGGVLGQYQPALIVKHKISQKRLEPAYYRHWHYIRGQYRDLIFPYKAKFYHPFGIPFWLYRTILIFFFRSLGAHSYAERLRLQCWGSLYLGQAVKIAKKIGADGNTFTQEITL